MVKEAIILAGGLGTRLRSVVKDIPKPMANINGKPFLEYILLYLKSKGILKVILAVSYKWEIIRNYFGKEYEGLEIVYSIEHTPFGTGGAIKKAIDFVEFADICILNGDTFFNVDLKKFFEFHKNKDSILSIALKKMENIERYGTVEINNENRITAFYEKQYKRDGLINGGIYLLNKDFLLSLNLPNKFSFEKDLLEMYYKIYPFYGLPFDSYFIDIGVPGDYEKAKRDFQKFEYR